MVQTWMKQGRKNLYSKFFMGSIIMIMLMVGLIGRNKASATSSEQGVKDVKRLYVLSDQDIKEISDQIDRIVKTVKSKGLTALSFEKDISTPQVHFSKDIEDTKYVINVEVKEKIGKIKSIHFDNPYNIRVINGNVLSNLILYIEYKSSVDIQNWELKFKRRGGGWKPVERSIIQYYTLSKIKVLPGEVYRLHDFDLVADSVKVHVNDGYVAIGYAGEIPTAAVLMGDIEFIFQPVIRMEAEVLLRNIGSYQLKGKFKRLYMRFHPGDLKTYFDISKLEVEPLKKWRKVAQEVLDEREDAIDDLDMLVKSPHLKYDWSYVPPNRTFLLMEIQDNDQNWYTYIHDPLKDEQVWFGVHRWVMMSNYSEKVTWCRFSCLHQEDRHINRQHPKEEKLDIQHYTLEPTVVSDGMVCTAQVEFVNRGVSRSELRFTLYRELEVYTVFDEDDRALLFFQMGNNVIVPLVTPVKKQDRSALTFMYRGGILTKWGGDLVERTYVGQQVVSVDTGDTVSGLGLSSPTSGVSDQGGGSVADSLTTNAFQEEENSQSTSPQVRFLGEVTPFWPEEFNEIGAGEGGDVLAKSSPDTFFEVGYFPWIPAHGYRDRATVTTILRVPQPFMGISNGKKVKEWKEGVQNCSIWKETTPIVQPAFCYGNYLSHKSMADYTDLQVLGEKDIRQDLGTLNLSDASNRVGRIYERNEKRLLHESENAIKLFNELFGKYPFEKLFLAQMPSDTYYNFNVIPASYSLLPVSLFLTSAQKMQINLPVNVKFNADLLGSNIARQWLGQLIGSSSYHDQWLLDSLAEYCGGMFLQAVFGHDDFKGWLKNKLKIAKKYDSAGVLYLGPRLGGKYVDLYRSKGAYVMHMLRMMLGDKYFAKALQTFTRQYRNRNITTDDFKRTFEIVGITDLDYFFNQWVYSSGIPNFIFSYTSEKLKNGQYLIKCKVIQKNKVVKMPVPIWIYTGRKEKGKVLVWIDKPEEEFSFKINRKPKKITFDEFHWVLAEVEGN